MKRLIKIGNSQGIRIPKNLIKEAKLQDKQIDLVVLKNGLLLQPKETKKIRTNWDSTNLQKLAKKHDKELKNLHSEFASSDTDISEWEW